MNIEDFREYCLSLGDDVTEKTPFGKFARRYDSVLVFYVAGHMFCLTDMNDFSSIDVRSTPEEIEKLYVMSPSAVGKPINKAMKVWISLYLGRDMSDNEVRALVKRAYEIIKTKYSDKKQ